jgi:hypothetical protein
MRLSGSGGLQMLDVKKAFQWSCDMAEVPISGPVGAPPAKNLPADVSTVQTLLANVKPPLAARVTISGGIDAVTIQAIREFQRRFMSFPDGRVDPDGRTIWHLNDGFVSKYIGLSADRRRTIDRDIINAQKWLSELLGQLNSPLSAGMKQKVKNIFHIDADDGSQTSRLKDLVARYQRLRFSFDQSFPLQFDPKRSIYGAYVKPGDPSGTIFFPPNYFEMSADERAEKIVHERAHTVFNIGHDGMPPSGAVDFSKAADDDNGFTYQQSLNNAYCFGWLAAAAQPGYVPDSGGAVITVNPKR